MRTTIDIYIQLKNKFPLNTIIKHKACNLEEKIIDFKYDLFNVYVKLESINYLQWKDRRKPKWFYYDILREYEKK